MPPRGADDGPGRIPWLSNSPVDLLLGGIVAALAGCDLAVARYVAHHTACRRTGYRGLLGALPSFLLGFTCRTPTVLLALSTGAGAAASAVSRR
ncbi:hypothetical protein SAMN05216266_110123 [Amycolatopsis marina]|uniref:Uncharacterized protein n=1 Tax=Amycolatopsis marina TaxID=490629 RepID=A0A1I1AX54_9PSEU|nr:hypothetical protein [Amycolatopsis marina]SFB40920.1 hypothetical protein SAMN05216266_110123 [Amycolatopsis marina]